MSKALLALTNTPSMAQTTQNQTVYFPCQTQPHKTELSPASTLLPNSPIQPIPNIPHPRLNHPLLRQLPITTPNPKLAPLSPLARRPNQALPRRNNIHHDNATDAPLPQRLNRRDRCAARCDYRVDDYGCVRWVRRGRGGEVVVILDGLEGGFLAVEAEVVDGDRVGKERLDGVDH